MNHTLTSFIFFFASLTYAYSSALVLLFQKTDEGTVQEYQNIDELENVPCSGSSYKSSNCFRT